MFWSVLRKGSPSHVCDPSVEDRTRGSSFTVFTLSTEVLAELEHRGVSVAMAMRWL